MFVVYFQLSFSSFSLTLLTFSPSLRTSEFKRRSSSSKVSFSCNNPGLELLPSDKTCVSFSSSREIALCRLDSVFNASLYSAFNSCLSRLGNCSVERSMAESDPSSICDAILVFTPLPSSST